MSSLYESFRQAQADMTTQVRVEPLRSSPQLVTAVDVHASQGGKGVAAAVSCDLSGAVIERVTAEAELKIPYVPGYLSFRELPVCLAAIKELRSAPDLVLVDGLGIAHPRRFGIACHLGLTLDVPTIGVAKSLLVGEALPPGRERGSMSDVLLDGELVGLAVRTRTDVSPVYLSVGHRVTLEEAATIVLQLSTRYRLPDPSRQAHLLARQIARDTRSKQG